MIAKDIYCIGVNDHRIDLFESQYTVPNGVSYNSYVITDGKQRCTRGYKRYKETSGLIEWKECQIFHSIFT